ncbi:polysaccharide biosynthesis tyrosine autokinase [Alteromonas sediminis]|uniref:non-specific protein-tyrosine kinase n=1 Tax=Alteromonas sediminis TaxID=2259342 RepID=A0A3N5XYP0_9ALTE|nr:XrtA-associated tyrosine autokinase [Alteromonas sediminis]RPJ65740.1 polysaccharide biosynthesis tyrosine autokinase [Alteromonas sediminis]
MSNTIEKALQRQREAEAAKKQQQSEKQEDTPAVSANATVADSESKPEPAIASENSEPSEKSEKKAKSYIIDLERLEENGHVSLLSKRSQVNEEYREIKRKLLQNGFGQLSQTLTNSNIIMVTSGRPSEGKTFTAVNLALSIAIEQDKTVLLVDADVLKPNVCNTLGIDKRKGLMDYLLGEVGDLSEVMYHTNIDKLKIIPSGKSHHLSTELLASKKMHDTVDEFANRYSDRVVIIDTPPLIGINESAILANFAGQAVVVTEEGKSRLNDIKFAVGRLNPDMAIGFVVNKSVNTDTDGTGYYGYYYAEQED